MTRQTGRPGMVLDAYPTCSFQFFFFHLSIAWHGLTVNDHSDWSFGALSREYVLQTLVPSGVHVKDPYQAVRRQRVEHTWGRGVWKSKEGNEEASGTTLYWGCSTLGDVFDAPSQEVRQFREIQADVPCLLTLA